MRQAGGYDKGLWTQKRLQAAELLAEGNLSQREIALKVGAAERTIKLWVADAGFKAKINEFASRTQNAMIKVGIRVKENRLLALQDRVDRLNLIIQERQNAEGHEGEAGWKSGLLIKKGGPNSTFYLLDEKLLRELREHEKQAAIEMGEWTEKRELTGEGGGAIKVIIEYSEQLTNQDDQDSAPEAP